MKRLGSWLRNQRSSTRLSFVLQICCRILFSLFSFIWTPLLLNAMGRSLNGLFLNFHKLASLGVTGDFGLGGLINIQTSRLLGQQKEAELQDFLAAARGVFLVIGAVAGTAFIVLSPALFRALHFGNEPRAGSLLLLALVGGATVTTLVFSGYTTNLNYGCGNTLWPIVPAFVILQLSLAGHWLLAREQTPLWIQYLPYFGSSGVILLFGWWLVRVSHPRMGALRPLRFGIGVFWSVGAQSFWMYLYSIATGIYTGTDTFLISAGFGPEWVPVYQYNYRLYELAIFVVQSASLVSLPKITQWIVSPDDQVRQRGMAEALRLNRFQTFLGCCAAFICLNVNDWFVRLWLGKEMNAPLSWQIAFAANLGITAAGMIGSDLVARCGEHGIRFGGLTVLAASLLNFGLSFIAMKRGSIAGIAAATVIAMTAQSLVLCRYSSRRFRISWWRLSLKNWLLVLAFVGAGTITKIWVAPVNAAGIATLIAAAALMVAIAGWCAGITLDDLRHEKRIFHSIFTRPKPASEQQRVP